MPGLEFLENILNSLLDYRNAASQALYYDDANFLIMPSMTSAVAVSLSIIL